MVEREQVRGDASDGGAVTWTPREGISARNLPSSHSAHGPGVPFLGDGQGQG